MKAVTRSYFWWPGLDKDIEKVASSCTECKLVKKAPPSAPLNPWVWPTKPWERIHLDFAVHEDGQKKAHMEFTIPSSFEGPR